MEAVTEVTLLVCTSGTPEPVPSQPKASITDMQIEDSTNFEKNDSENIKPVDQRLLGFDIIIFNAGSNIIRASQGSAGLTIQVLISIDSRFILHVNLLCEAESYCMEN